VKPAVLRLAKSHCVFNRRKTLDWLQKLNIRTNPAHAFVTGESQIYGSAQNGWRRLARLAGRCSEWW
jgi:hypothetical protein